MIDVKHLVNMSINIDVNLTNSLKNKEFSELICETCVINKQNRTSSWKSYIRVIKVNELIYLNLINDDKIFKINKEFRYVITIIDDCSQFMIICLLERKFNLKNIL